MKIPKWFEKWFRLYGIGDECIDAYPRLPVRRIAYRAYRKGKKDGMEIVHTCMKYKTAKRRC
jgi:hypothetical protein